MTESSSASTPTSTDRTMVRQRLDRPSRAVSVAVSASARITATAVAIPRACGGTSITTEIGSTAPSMNAAAPPVAARKGA
jgi:hypothetical protein